MWSHFIEVPPLEEVRYYLDRQWMPQDKMRQEVILEFTSDGFEADFWLQSTIQRQIIHFWSIRQNGWIEKWGIEIPSYNQNRTIVELTDDIVRQIYQATHKWNWITWRLIINTSKVTIEILDELNHMPTSSKYLH